VLEDQDNGLFCRSKRNAINLCDNSWFHPVILSEQFNAEGVTLTLL